MASETYLAINKAWKATCRVLFREEIGELSDFEEWLKGYDEPRMYGKSFVSGKGVALPTTDYAKSARFVSFEEVDFGKKFEPLNINEMKDIDGIVQAVSERACYTGDVVLGNSNYIEKSSGIINGNFIYESTFVNDSKYVAFSRYVHFCEHVFGFLGTEKSSHIVMGSGSDLTRCFECHMSQDSQDCYYCGKIKNCREAMFCFGAENKAHLIGNTELPKDKYLGIKAKLISEIASELRKEKRIFSLLDILRDSSRFKSNALGLEFAKEGGKKFEIGPLETAFSKTAQILFGKPLHGLESYAPFLQKHVPPNIFINSAISGNRTTVCGYRTHLIKRYGFEKRMASEEELREIGNCGIGEEKLQEISISREDISKILHPIAYFNLEKDVGTNINVKDSAVVIDASDCLHCAATVRSKKCAYCFWPSESESVFGGFAVFNSSFVINAHDSTRISRGFELDGCRNCSDIFFSHNCENVQDSMFCFNVKNKRNAIGNTEIGKEDYAKIKKNVLSQVAGELEKRKDLKWDVFNAGSGI